MCSLRFVLAMVAIIPRPAAQADLGTVPRAQAPWPLALRLSGGSYQHAAGARSVTVLDRAETAGDDESVARQGRLHGDEDKLQRRLARDLRRAAEHGDMRALAASLQAGVDVDVVDCSGFTALHIAAEKGHYDVVEELLTRGASVERREYISGWTPLHAAAYASQSRVVPVLVKHGAQVETVDYAGATAMLLACRAGCLHTIRALHSLNASIWAKQPDGSDVRSALQSNGELMTDECDAILAFLEEVASNQSGTNTLRGRGPMRLSGGFAEATGAVDVASGESVPEPEGPPLPDPSHGPPPARSFLKVSEDGEIWVEKDGVVQEEKDRGDSLFPTSAAKVVESIDLGPDPVCACALCSGSDATVAGGGNLVGGVEGDSVDRQGGMHDAVIPQHLVKDFNDNLDAVCAEFRDGQAVAGARAEARADSSAEQHDGPQLPSGRCADKSSHRQGLTTRPIVSCSGPGWQFPGEWQQPRDSGLTVSAGEAEVAEGAGEVEWEDDSDPARFKCVGSVANGRIDDKILLDDLDAPVIDDTIRPRAASGMLSAARSEDTHAIARSAAVSAKTGIDDVQPEHGDWESAARASALRRGDNGDYSAMSGADSDLFWAMQQADEEAALEALANGASRALLTTQLLEAAKEGHIARLRLALQLGGSVEAFDERGTNFAALHWAAIKGQCAAIPILVDAGAYVDQPGLSGSTPLQLAVIHGNPDVVQALLQAGASKHVLNDQKMSALNLAVALPQGKLSLSVLQAHA